jgi:16S rRNA (adenine1518-N6/adenine1519-N6)-dimethyltransferase
VLSADLTPDDHVIEVGPGVCALTGYICERAGSVVAVEIDRRLSGIIANEMSGFDNFTLINADFLRVGAESLLPPGGVSDGRRVKFISSLPYYISTPVMTRLFEEFSFVEKAVMMMQREVSDRLKAKPSEQDYCMLTAFAGSYCAPSRLFNVSPHCFAPQPGVDSVVMSFAAYDAGQSGKNAINGGGDEKRFNFFAGPAEKAMYFKVVRAAFASRRKTLENSLLLSGLAADRRSAGDAVLRANIKSGARGESLSPGDFVSLVRALMNKAAR